ncbi:MAG: esterase-like activity of phytase family protein [Gemmatimonadota bacterium]
MLSRRMILAIAAAALGGACQADEPMSAPRAGAPNLELSPGPAGVAAIYPVEPRSILATVNGIDVSHSGYGSAMARKPGDPQTFYLLTDRGPNYAAPGGAIAFAVPSFSPEIAVARRVSNEGNLKLQIQRILHLTNADGSAITGLPNPPGAGGTGEVPVAPDGSPLPLDPNGLDSEGLVALPDGTFWVSDEYGPHLVHFDANGRTIERINPFSSAKPLPLVLAQRRVNRGMEGLAAGRDDGGILIGIMQSPLDNPRAAGRVSTFTRIVWYETATGKTKQFLYPLDASNFSVSEIAAISANTFLVIERDGDFALGSPAAIQKKVYKIDLRGATDVSDPQNGPTGLLVNGKTLESLSSAEVAAANIKPVSKALVSDLLLLGYPHDKMEGVTVMDRWSIAVSNDDDFGVTDSPTGLAVKILPPTGLRDFGEVWFIRLSKPLW